MEWDPGILGGFPQCLFEPYQPPVFEKFHLYCSTTMYIRPQSGQTTGCMRPLRDRLRILGLKPSLMRDTAVLFWDDKGGHLFKIINIIYLLNGFRLRIILTTCPPLPLNESSPHYDLKLVKVHSARYLNLLNF